MIREDLREVVEEAYFVYAYEPVRDHNTRITGEAAEAKRRNKDSARLIEKIGLDNAVMKIERCF